MRAYFRLTANTEPVPFDYQHSIIGAVHRLLGNNDIHDNISLYSFSWLDGGMREGDALNFPRGASWFISAHDTAFVNEFINMTLKHPEFICGMEIANVRTVSAPQFHMRQRFMVASPVLVRCEIENNRVKHYTYNDEQSSIILTQTLKHKMDAAGLGDFSGSVKVEFDRSYEKAKTKLANIKGVSSRASLCPVIVQGHCKAVGFAWNVGIGNSTGCGFGAVR